MTDCLIAVLLMMATNIAWVVIALNYRRLFNKAIALVESVHDLNADLLNELEERNRP